MLSHPDDHVEPIAIVGMGCRFPGASNPAEYWELLCSGRTAIREVPKDRWNIDRFYSSNPNKPGKMHVRKGGFLDVRLDEFDAAFFGISPREALQIDPQQRLLLEVAWEAMEDAGVIPADLAGTAMGVYVGGFMLDNLINVLSPFNRVNLGTHTATTVTMTMLANRLSYCFDFRGPSVSFDTACSSSLVAVHFACQGLWSGECSMALVGGVNVMMKPEFPIVMSKGQYLSPDGYCKSFDARANGYGRGEGAGVVVLKPYSAAVRDGDEIYALIRGTGINQDGRTDGITVPNPDSQERLIRTVYGRYGVPLSKVRYVEAHGTGTAVGDPIEASALGRTVGHGRSNDDACVIGSTKAAIGHLEAAAGVAGLIKATLCAYHSEIPPQANLQTPNPKIPFEALGLRLPRQREPMPNGESPVYVGINGFGYGGTNAHVILEQLSRKPETAASSPEQDADRPHVLALSARDQKALKALAGSYADWLLRPNAPAPRDVCHSAMHRRSHLDQRLAVVGDSTQSIVDALAEFAEHGRSERAVSAKLPPHGQQQVVFVFTGMGPQWWAMGRELLEKEPVFRRTAESVDGAFRSVTGWSVLAEMSADKERSNMRRTEVAQRANFLLQVALAELLKSWGVQPSAVVGHSVGEVSAAYVAGALDLRDAITVSYHRSRLQQQVAGQGRMLATGLGVPDARAVLARREHLVSIAAVNSPGAVTLAGDADALEAIAAELEQNGVFNRFLQVEVPYHSPHMEPLKPGMREALAGVRPRAPSIPLYSTVTGRLVQDATLDTEYWCNNIREPVLFAEAISTIIEHGHLGFLEVGPHPVLANAIKDCLRQHDEQGHVFASLRREEPEQLTILMALAGLYTNGYTVNWRALSGDDACYVKLPHYAWQREKYWLESEAAVADRLGSVDHPLLGLRVAAPSPTWQCELDSDDLDYLKDHVVDGVAVFPGAGYVEQGLATHSFLDGGDVAVVENLEFHRAFVVPIGGVPVLRVTFDEESREYQVHSGRADEASAWTLHARGRISPTSPFPVQPVPLEEIRLRCQESIDGQGLYPRLAALGLEYGPAFQRVKRLWRCAGEALVEVGSLPSVDCEGYRIHPTTLDASLHSLVAALGDDNVDEHRPYVPVGIKRVTYRGKINGHCWSYVRLTKLAEDGIEGNIVLCDDDGVVLMELLGVRCQPVVSAKPSRADWVRQRSYVPGWEKADRPAVPAEPGRWLVLTEEGRVGADLVRALKARGADEVVEVPCEDVLSAGERDRKTLDQVLTQTDTLSGVVYLGALNETTEGEDPARGYATAGLLRLIQELVRHSSGHTPRLYVVTEGAQRVAGEDVGGVMQAPSVGLARTALSEHPELRCTVIDLDTAGGTESVHELAKELVSDSPETEVALRGSDRYVYRLLPLAQREGDGEAEPARSLPAAVAGAFQLEADTVGRTEGLRFRQIRRQRPGPGEVELQISAAALNFKDVLKVLNMLPPRALEETFFGTSLGMEAAGVITAVGEGVTKWQVGDEVAVFLRGAFRSHVTVPVDQIFIERKPTNMTFVEAASVPMVFVTAYHTLHNVARLSEGETVLIHAAAGGVGLAAIQVAQWLGAKVIATAGSDEKRDYLRSLGVEHVFNSRTLEFTDQVMELTNGRGVDVVLNSLSGEASLKSLTVVTPHGRFIQIDKRDLVDNVRMPMLAFNRGMSFSALDIDRMMRERPDLVRTVLHEVWQHVLAGDFSALPIEMFPAAQLADAFRHMAQAKHIGKIVISFEDLEATSVLPRKDKHLFDADASYLVTGGFGGFGLQVAQWMAQEGARHLVLVGRSGARTPEAQQVVKSLQERGVSVRAVAADIGEESQVRDLFSAIARSTPPLRGIMHAAAVLDDGLLASLDETRLQRVMAPKARGAWLLHRYSQALPLDFYVLFSSFSSLIGNAGQGNYVAANAFLDALAHYRHARGLPATSINWGAIAEVGMVGKDSGLEEHLARVGIHAIAPKNATAALAVAMKTDAAQIGFVDVDWAKLRQFNPAAASPKFSQVVSKEGATDNSATSQIRAALLAAEPKDRPELLALIMAELVAEAMRLPSDRIDIHQPLTEMGIDSLMAVELQMGIHESFGIEFPVLELVKGESILALAQQLLSRMDVATDVQEGQGDPVAPGAAAAA